MTWEVISGFVAIAVTACIEAIRDARRQERGTWRDEHGKWW